MSIGLNRISFAPKWKSLIDYSFFDQSDPNSIQSISNFELDSFFFLVKTGPKGLVWRLNKWPCNPGKYRSVLIQQGTCRRHGFSTELGGLEETVRCVRSSRCPVLYLCRTTLQASADSVSPREKVRRRLCYVRVVKGGLRRKVCLLYTSPSPRD